ncbi:hypothetical protein B4U80_10116, partial [Leptotrombidium deliense]
MYQLRNECEKVKILLQTVEEAKIDLHLEDSDETLSLLVTADYFNDDLLYNYFLEINEIDKINSFAAKRHEKFDRVIAGGSSRLKPFQEQFYTSIVEFNDDCVVAKGAALFAMNCRNNCGLLEDISTDRIIIKDDDRRCRNNGLLSSTELATTHQRLPIDATVFMSLLLDKRRYTCVAKIFNSEKKFITLTLPSEKHAPTGEDDHSFRIGYSMDTNGCLKINHIECKETEEIYICNLYISTDENEAKDYRRFIDAFDKVVKKDTKLKSIIEFFSSSKLEMFQKFYLIKDDAEYQSIRDLHSSIIQDTEKYVDVSIIELENIATKIKQLNENLNNAILRVESEITEQKISLEKTTEDIVNDMSNFETCGCTYDHALKDEITALINKAKDLLQGSGSLNILKELEKKLIDKKKLFEYLINKAERKSNKLKLQSRFETSMVGQKNAISVVAQSVLRKTKAWMDENRPLSFLFLGSSGIGKTHLAKEIAKYIHPHKKQKGFIRIDLSEYLTAEDVSKFIGSPPGYEDHKKGGQLTTALKKCPNAVVLFDEVEKAHRTVLTPLLQLFDEGRLTDGKGVTTYCKGAIFIMTSNLGTDAIFKEFDSMKNKHIESGGTDEDFDIEDYCSYDDLREKFTPILKEHFQREEFLGRINEFVYFFPFTDKEVKLLAEIELEKKKISANEKNLNLTWDDNVIDIIAAGFNTRYGARSLENEANREVGSLLASAQEAKEIKAGDCIILVTTNRSQFKLKLLINHEKFFRCGK